MIRLFVCQVLLLLCASASSQTIHKWTDENGRVHYGDRSESAKGRPTTTVAAPPPPPAPVPGAQSPGKETTGAAPVEEVAQAPWTQPPNVQKCLVMAKAMADAKDMTPSDIRARSKELFSLCPNTAYECVRYRSQPGRNTCEAVAYRPGGSIVRTDTFQ